VIQVLSIKQREFIEAAKALGLPTWHIVFRELMPNLMSYIAINFIFATTGAIYASVGLYFLGVLPFTTFNWGIMLNMAYAQAGVHYSINAIHYILAPNNSSNRSTSRAHTILLCNRRDI